MPTRLAGLRLQRVEPLQVAAHDGIVLLRGQEVALGVEENLRLFIGDRPLDARHVRSPHQAFGPEIVDKRATHIA